MGKRYAGAMISREGVRWLVEIWQADYSGPVGELEFPAEEPLLIEWQERDKEEVVAGSSATLRVISPGDRTYADLYTVGACRVRMDVWREGVLYWSGTMDTEFYEEPYERARDYEVGLTFSDFGVLDRLEWDGTGVMTVGDILRKAVEMSGIRAAWTSADAYISTYFEGGREKAVPDKLAVNAENFYDEDGEASTMAEVVEGVLQPLGLRMVQRSGRVWIYDLNGLHDAGERREIYWSGDSQTLGTDKVANNVRVTFSPYDNSTVIDGELEHGDVLAGETGRLVMTGNHWDEAAEGFRICHGDQTGLPVEVMNGAKYFRADAAYSGSDEAGVVWAYKWLEPGTTTDRQMVNSTFPRAMGSNGKATTVAIMRVEGIRVCHPPLIEGTRLRLKVMLSVLADVRYNPHEQPATDNDEGNYDRLKNWANFAYVPVMLRLIGDDGEVLMHYSNEAMLRSNRYDIQQECGWRAGEGKWGSMWLCYYDASNRKSASGLGGWQENRQSIGYYRDDLPRRLTAQGTGELIPLPPMSGRIVMEVGRGLYQIDYGKEEKDIYSLMRWLMYKDASVTLVNRNGTDIDREDIEYSGWLNREAKDGISIDTICGTADEAMPTARGIYMLALTGGQVQKLVRAGVTDHPERLLIGTLYSQYAERHTVLSGEARIDPEGLAVYTDRCQPEGRVFMIRGEVQDIATDCSEVTIVELSGDNYEGIEYE